MPVSFENLHQSPFVTLLDDGDPLLLVDEVEDMYQHGAVGGVVLDPDRAWGCRDDAGKCRQPVRVAHVERDTHEARPPISRARA